MKIFLFILLFFLNAVAGIAQGEGKNADSLKKLLMVAKEDTTRVFLLIQTATAYIRLNPDSALPYALDGFKLAQKIKFKTGEYYSIVALAWCWWSIGDYSTGIGLLLPKVKEIESTHDTALIGDANGALADSYRDQGNYDQALIYYFKGGNLDRNCTYCKIIDAAVASAYLGKKRLDSAQFYINRAFTDRPDPYSDGWPEYIRGETYAGLQKYDSAFFYYRQSIPKLLKRHNLKDLTNVFNSMAALSRSIGLNDSAFYYANKALSVALSKRFAKEAMEAYLQISSSYELLNTDSALRYYKLAIAAKDTLYNQEKQRQILSYQFNEQLHQQQIENTEAQFRSRMKIYILLGAVIIFLILGLLLLRNNRYKIAELKHKATELEMHALRSQMNPHFIFNSLTSINMFILENNKIQASEYLSKFSRLVRLILQNSKEAFIPLERELEALQLYLELESLRFGNKFEYKISMDYEIDTTVLKVPPLIVQPYAENAIWHGLMSKKEKGHLEINLYQRDKILFCKITDDGIGRKEASSLKNKTHATNKSMGMRITADRIALLQQQKDKNTFISITDLVLPDGKSNGTEVLIKIPVHCD